MWLTFFGAVLVACVLLYVPGYFVLRALNFSPFIALTAAPIPSCFLIITLSTALALSGVFCTGSLICVIILSISLGFYALRVVTNKRAIRLGAGQDGVTPIGTGPSNKVVIGGHNSSFKWILVALYVIFGLLVWVYVFASSITGSPDALFSRWDNQAHMNFTRAYADSGVWSVFHSDYYLNVPSEVNPFYTAEAANSLSFYPSGWHIITACLFSLVGASVPLCANAINLVISSVVYPLGMLLLLSVLFPRNNKVLFFGAFTDMAFTAFPWGLFVKGPLYPQLLSFALLPIFLGLFIMLFEQGLVRKRIFAFLAICVIGLLDLVFAQTNGVFSAYIFLAAYLTHHIYSELKRTAPKGLEPFLTSAGFILIVVAFWAFCFQLPSMQSIVSYEWEPVTTVPFAIAMAGSFAMPAFYPEPILAILAVVGLVYSLRSRSYWILVPAFIMMVGFALDRSSTSLVRHFITGFWYTDPFRSAACYAIFVTPVVCLGFACFADWAYKLKDSLPAALQDSKVYLSLITVVFCIITFMPNLYLMPDRETDICITTAFGSLHSRFKDFYRTDVEQVFSTTEEHFVEKVLETIPENALVINQPQDGSVFAYASSGLNVYYRHCGTGTQNKTARLIRSNLVDYAENTEVQKAVNSISAGYLLQLDQGVSFKDGVWMPQYENPQLWNGIDSINDATLGFEVVLAEDDMRLYRIVPIQEIESAA